MAYTEAAHLEERTTWLWAVPRGRLRQTVRKENSKSDISFLSCVVTIK
jgi:hypothetical protein